MFGSLESEAILLGVFEPLFSTFSSSEAIECKHLEEICFFFGFHFVPSQCIFKRSILTSPALAALLRMKCHVNKYILWLPLCLYTCLECDISHKKCLTKIGKSRVSFHTLHDFGRK